MNGYKKKRTIEKGQGSEAEMANLKRVNEESVKDLGMLLMIYIVSSSSGIANKHIEGILPRNLILINQGIG